MSKTITFRTLTRRPGQTLIVDVATGETIAEGKNVGTAIENAHRGRPNDRLIELGRNPVGWDMIEV